MSAVTLTICTTCRAGIDPDGTGARQGGRLHTALSDADLPEGVTLKAVECLSACSRGCSLVLEGGPQRWTYIYGDMNPDIHVPQIVQGVAAYTNTEDGLVPWRERPDVFRKQSIARIPPREPIVG